MKAVPTLDRGVRLSTGDSWVASTRKPGSLTSRLTLTSTPALRECWWITTSNGAVLPPFTLRDGTTTIALDMLGHCALTKKVFETPGWSKVVMVAAHKDEAGQADRCGPRDLRTGQG
jgi:hypothetical protein